MDDSVAEKCVQAVSEGKMVSQPPLSAEVLAELWLASQTHSSCQK